MGGRMAHRHHKSSTLAALVACAALACGDSRSREGDSCAGPGRQCGADDLGIECTNGQWDTICYQCKDVGSTITCAFEICVAPAATDCGEPTNTHELTCRYSKDGTGTATQACPGLDDLLK